MQPIDSKLNAFGCENWTVLEENCSGFSVELGKEISAWVKSGALIGYATLEYKNKIALAEIRTVRKKSDGTYRLGLLKVTSNVIALKVYRQQKSSIFESVSGCCVNDGEENLTYSDAFSGLLSADKSKLIVPRHQYKLANRYKVSMNGSGHTVLAGEVLNSHCDWICFEVIV